MGAAVRRGHAVHVTPDEFRGFIRPLQSDFHGEAVVGCRGFAVVAQPAFAIKHEVRGGFVAAIPDEPGEIFFNALFMDEVVRLLRRAVLEGDLEAFVKIGFGLEGVLQQGGVEGGLLPEN